MKHLMRSMRMVSWYTAMLSVSFFCISNAAEKNRERSIRETIKYLDKQGKNLTFDHLVDFKEVVSLEAVADFINQFSLPLGNNISIRNKGPLYFIRGKARLGDVRLFSEIRIDESTDTPQVSVRIRMPDAWQFSDLLPELVDLDFVKVEKAALVLSTHEYTSRVWGKIKKGINIVGGITLQGNDNILLQSLLGEGRAAMNFACFIDPKDIKNSLLRVRTQGKFELIYKAIDFFSIPLSEQVKTVMGEAAITDMRFAVSGRGFTFRGKGAMFGTQVSVVLDMLKNKEGAWQSRLSVALPDGWKLSDTFKGLESYDIFSFKRLGFVLSNYAHKDPFWGSYIKPGIHVVGRLNPEGGLKLISDVIGIGLNELVVSGVIQAKIEDTTLDAKIPGDINLLNIAEKHLSITIPQEVRTLLGDGSFTLPRISISPQTIRITASRKLYGAKIDAGVEFAYGAKDIQKYRLFVRLPNTWRLSRAVPQLKFLDFIRFKKLGLVLSSTTYKDSRLNVTIEPGLNLVGTIAVGDVKLAKALSSKFNNLPTLKAVMDHIFKQRFDLIHVHGVITPEGVGTSFFYRVGKGLLITPGLRLKGTKVVIAVREVLPGTPGPVIGVQGGLEVELPTLQKESLGFTGGIDVSSEKAQLWGRMDGMLSNVLGLGIDLGNVVLGASTDFKLLAETEGLALISGLAIGGGFGIGKPPKRQEVQLAMKIEASGAAGLGDFIIDGSIPEGASLQTVVSLAGGFFRQSLTTDQEKHTFDASIEKYIPPLEVGQSHLVVSYKDGEIAGKRYKKGIKVDINNLSLFKKKASLFVEGGMSGIRGRGSIDSFSFGPLSVTGKTDDEGPVLDLAFSPEEQFFNLSGKVALDVFGGISSDIDLAVLPRGLRGLVEHKLFGLYESELNVDLGFTGEGLTPAFSVNGAIKLVSLPELGSFLTQKIRAWLQEMNSKFGTVKVKSAARKVADWVDEQKAAAEKKLQDLIALRDTCDAGYADIDLIGKAWCYKEKGHPLLLPEIEALKVYNAVTLPKLLSDTIEKGINFVEDIVAVWVEGIGNIGDLLAAQNGLVKIDELSFKGRYHKQHKKVLFVVTLVGSVFGKQFSIQDMYINPQNIERFIEKVIPYIIREVLKV